MNPGAFPNFCLILTTRSLICCAASPLFHRNTVVKSLTLSSQNEIQYFHPPIEVTLADPQTSVMNCFPGT